MMKPSGETRAIRLLAYLLPTALACLAGLDLYVTDFSINYPQSLAPFRFLLLGVVGLVVAGLWLYGLTATWSGRRPRTVEKLLDNLAKSILWWRVAVSAIILAIPAYLFLFSQAGNYFYERAYWLKLLLVLLCGFVCAVLLFPRVKLVDWLMRFAGIMAVAGAFYAMGSLLARVTGYPFSLSWSEGNRFWDYSMMFGSGRYLTPTGKPATAFIEAGRQLLWAIPFLIPGAGIWLMRLWDALLWILLPLALGLILGRVVLAAGTGLGWRVIVACWTVAFLAQGPIYPTLVLVAILVVFSVRIKNIWLSCLLVAGAGFYANMSRWSWTYAPGLWAGMLALLELNEPGFRNGKWKGLLRPVALGLAGYAGGQLLPWLLGVNGLAGDQTSQAGLLIDAGQKLSRQPFLWDRFFPNTTFTPGILVGMVWAGLPLIMLLVWAWRKRVWQLNWLQSLGVVIPNLAFLIVGLVASVKIGSGSNLHNLDMLWLSLVMLAAWALRKIYSGDKQSTETVIRLRLLIGLVLALPAAYLVQYGTPLQLPPADITSKDMGKIQQAVASYQRSGEILFLDQRQLLTFGDVPEVPLVSEYEKKYMMEQAIRGNADYFQTFYGDLAAHRFSLIISEPLQTHYQGEDFGFGNENDAFVKWVSIPVLCYYQPLDTLESGIQLLFPRSKPLQAQNITCPDH